MENSPNTSETSWVKRNVRLLVVIGSFLFIGIFFYFQFASAASIPSDFLSLYHDQDQRAKQVLQTAPFAFGQLAEYMKNNDPKSAYDLTTKGMNQTLTNSNRVDSLHQQFIMLKASAAGVADTKISGKFLKLFSLIEDRNKQLRQLVILQKDVFSTLRQYYAALMAGQQVKLPETVISSVDNVNRDIQAANDLQIQIDTAYSDLLSTAGLTAEQVTMEESVRGSLTKIPDVEVTVTDIPVNTPAPTLGQPQGPVASPTAELSPAPSASASSPIL